MLGGIYERKRLTGEGAVDCVRTITCTSPISPVSRTHSKRAPRIFFLPSYPPTFLTSIFFLFLSPAPRLTCFLS